MLTKEGISLQQQISSFVLLSQMIMFLSMCARGMLMFLWGYLRKMNFSEVVWVLSSHKKNFGCCYSENSRRKHCWLLKTLEQWQNMRNQLVRKGNFTGKPIEKYFNTMTPDKLNYALPRFIHEVSKKDHSFYPAETLYSLIVCL